MNNVRDFGAVGDGTAKDTVAIQKAIDAGGMVYFPPGIYLSGTLYLKSNGGLDLAPGAVLLGSPDQADYNADDFCPQNYACIAEKSSGAHLIIALEQHNIVIQGGGRIDGNRQAFYDKPRQNNPAKFEVEGWRPGQMIFLCECENVTVEDVELYNTTYWTLFLHGCEQVSIRGLRIWNDQRTPNGDGIDLDCCRFVTVSDCIIHSGDDCITLRGVSARLKRPRTCEYVTISNCVLSSPCCAFRIGVGTGLIRSCLISNCVIQNTRSGIQVVSRFNPKSPGVTIENISFSNIIFECKRPIAVLSDVRGSHDDPIEPIRNIFFQDLRGYAVWSNLIEANHRGDIQNIRFRNVSFEYSGGEDILEGEGLIYGESGDVRNSPAAFHATNAEQLEFDNVEIRWTKNASLKWKYTLLANNCELPRLERCRFEKESCINGKIMP